MFMKCYLHFVKEIGKGRCNGSLKYRVIYMHLLDPQKQSSG